MTVATPVWIRQNTDEPPDSDLGRLAVCVPTAGTRYAVDGSSSLTHFQHASGRNARGMSVIYHRQKAEGQRHRARLRAQILPNLWRGSRVPSSGWLGRFLGVHPSEAYRHMRRVLAEDGIGTETRGAGRARRIYVTSIQNWRAAA